MFDFWFLTYNYVDFMLAMAIIYAYYQLQVDVLYVIYLHACRGVTSLALCGSSVCVWKSLKLNFFGYSLIDTPM